MASKNITMRLTRGFSSLPKRTTRPFQVAIDGPAASGKSTTAKMVAQRLGFDYIDTGAFYRCVTLAALTKGLDPSNPSQAAQISRLAQSSHIGLKTVFSTSPTSSSPSSSFNKLSLPTTQVFLDNKDVSLEIRTGTVSKHVSAIAAIGPVREAVLQKVRDMGATSEGSDSERDGLVMDGRDIGTVVLPNADLKIFLVADSRVRAERRLQELAKNGGSGSEEVLDVETVQKDLERRDELDRTRKVSPLRKADDAVELDTSHLTIDGQVDAIVQEVHRRQA
ncbi:hypothetical protein BGW39_001293 [Mortierella sp. 14UC]|nr:hypothetical protein BGW39_001293 [Mortierella sp. 14UC]